MNNIEKLECLFEEAEKLGWEIPNELSVALSWGIAIKPRSENIIYEDLMETNEINLSPILLDTDKGRKLDFFNIISKHPNLTKYKKSVRKEVWILEEIPYRIKWLIKATETIWR